MRAGAEWQNNDVDGLVVVRFGCGAPSEATATEPIDAAKAELQALEFEMRSERLKGFWQTGARTN